MDPQILAHVWYVLLMRDGPFVVVFPQLICTGEGKNLINLFGSLSVADKDVWEILSVWFNVVRQPKLGRRNSRSGQIYVRNELEICMKIYNRGNAKYYYIDKVFSLIFSPERTIATLSLLSQLNIKIDSGLELSLVEGLVWLPSPPPPFLCGVDNVVCLKFASGTTSIFNYLHGHFFLRWFSWSLSSTWEIFCSSLHVDKCYYHLYLKYVLAFILVAVEVLSSLWVRLLKMLLHWATRMCTQSIISSSCVCLPRWQYCLRESEHTHSARHHCHQHYSGHHCHQLNHHQ